MASSTRVADDPIAVATAWERMRSAVGRVLCSSMQDCAGVEELCTRVVGAEVRSRQSIPKARVSIKDGFAVRAEDAGWSTRKIVRGLSMNK